jgi:hypothetical protein
VCGVGTVTFWCVVGYIVWVCVSKVCGVGTVTVWCVVGYILWVYLITIYFVRTATELCIVVYFTMCVCVSTVNDFLAAAESQRVTFIIMYPRLYKTHVSTEFCLTKSEANNLLFYC